MDQYEQQRREKLERLKELGEIPFRNDLKPDAKVVDIRVKYDSKTKEELEGVSDLVTIAGRIMGSRSFGKSAFLDLRDDSDRMQLFYQKKNLPEDRFEAVKLLEVGDIVWIKGKPFKTRTGELTLEIQEFALLVKSFHTLPEKWHGLQDVESRYRQRYLDMIMSPDVKATFKKRFETIAFLRNFLSEKGFCEVETPMMHPIPGGAAAKPFITHHNKLHTDLYLRIAPELYLKRLLVGGWDKVFELNRNFRNEGISIQHNPEFTMLEFYQTYATYEDLIKLTEEMLSKAAIEITGSDVVKYQDTDISFKAPFARYTLHDSLVEIGKVPKEVLESRDAALKYAEKLGDKLKSEKEGLGAILTEIFELVVEGKIVQPTFITHFPTEVSPLARRNSENPDVTDRFELYAYGREIANAFSELNDADDQMGRFEAQVQALDKGDEEAMHYDHDFINALQYGMPPAAGEGIGIDRLVMFFTDSLSIRDVILFPQLKSKTQKEKE